MISVYIYYMLDTSFTDFVCARAMDRQQCHIGLLQEFLQQLRVDLAYSASSYMSPSMVMVI
jgi:hypothetical protein